ncbi:MAG TPA: hypothetical protein VIB79_04220 [Candidatus Binatia bacterium]
MKRKHVAAPRYGIEPIREPTLRASGLVRERQWRAPCGNPEWHAFDVLFGLLFDTGERVTGGFGFDRADRFAVNEQRVVRFACFERELADGDTARSGEIDGLFILNVPTGLCQ